jgi:tight adherence protein C
MSLSLTIAFMTFLAVTGYFFYLFLYLERSHRRTQILKRLSGFRSEKAEAGERRAAFARSAFLHSLGRAALPRKTDELSTIRERLVHAGFRSEEAPVVYFGIKCGLGLGLGAISLLLLLLTGNLSVSRLPFVFFPLAAGYYLPEVYLRMRVAARKRKIFKELPDTLDLLLICIEAGLSFDIALYQVSRELRDIAPVLSKEFGRYFLEIKSGLPRKTVMNNLAERNGEQSLSSVIKALQQSARFGTDIATALRTYIDAIRIERRQIAEEKSAKISSRLTFPMVALILPALLIIILGPTIINIAERIRDGF